MLDISSCFKTFSVLKTSFLYTTILAFPITVAVFQDPLQDGKNYEEEAR